MAISEFMLSANQKRDSVISMLENLVCRISRIEEVTLAKC